MKTSKLRRLVGAMGAVALTAAAGVGVPQTADAQTGMDSDSETSSESSESTETMDDSSSSSSSSMSESSSTSSSGGTSDARAGEGNWSISLSVPNGGNPYADGTAGAWYMLQDQINLGVNLGLGIESQTVVSNYGEDNQSSTSTTGLDLLLAPALRYYFTTDSSIAPYFLGQLNFHKYFDGNNDTSANPDDDNFNGELQPELALVGGFGVEWFPVERFSIGGHVGLGIDLIRQNQLNGDQLTRNGLRIGTFTSSINANLYF